MVNARERDSGSACPGWGRARAVLPALAFGTARGARGTAATVLLALGLVLAGRSPAAAQDAGDRPTRVFLEVGLGGASGGDDMDGIGGMAQLTWQRAPHHAALRGLGVTELISGGDALSETGVLYGRTAVFGWGHVAAAGGLSLVTVSRGVPDLEFATVGLPLTAEAALEYRVLGLGVQLFANLNAEASFWGLMLFLNGGWMPVR